MTDDDILNMFEPGSEYSRDQVVELADAVDDEDRIFVSRALGRLKRWGKIEKTDSGKWRLVPEGQRVVQTKAAKAANNPVIKKLSPEPEKYEAIHGEVRQNPKPEETPESSIHDALVRVQAKLNGAGVDDYESKLYALQFLGKILDPTIDKMFQSIAGDLKRLNGL